MTSSTDAVSVTAARPMRADARRNYDALVAAAREQLTARGVDASMEDIARRAGVGVGTLYRHFPRRIDLVEAVYAHDIDGLSETAVSCTELDPWIGLVTWLEAFVAYAEAKRSLLNEMHEAFERNPDLRVQIRERILAAGGLVLARAQDAAVCRADMTPADLLQLVGGMCMSATTTKGQNERLLTVIIDGLRIS